MAENRGYPYWRSWSSPELGIPPKLLLESSFGGIVMIQKLGEESRTCSIHSCCIGGYREFIIGFNGWNQPSFVKERMISCCGCNQQRDRGYN